MGKSILKEERQDALAALRKWTLERDDSGEFRVYRDSEGKPYYSVTTILSHTAPEAKKRVLQKWLNKPGSEEQLELACARGSISHEHCEYVYKTASRIAINIGNSRGNWRTYETDGLSRVPKAITTQAIKTARKNAPKIPWACRKYARNLAAWIEENTAAIHASEFSVCHPDGFAGCSDALIDYGPKPGNLCIVDFKTSSASKEKPDEWLQDHIDQLAGYSYALEHQSGLRPTMGVVVIARENGVQVREVSQLELLGAKQRFLERLEMFKDLLKESFEN